MAWSASAAFAVGILDRLKGTASFDWDGDTMTIALYDNSITPDKAVAAAASGYTGGVWTATGSGSGTAQVYQAGQWAQGGVNLASVTVAQASNVVTFDAADTASGAAATLSNVYGGFIYDNTLTTPVADQGMCFLYFGGPSSVTSGTLTVQYSGSGIIAFTV